LAIPVTSFHLFLFLLFAYADIRRYTVLRSLAGAGTLKSSSPPFGRSAPGASSSRREAFSSTLPR
jgi:hypothetical protein